MSYIVTVFIFDIQCSFFDYLGSYVFSRFVTDTNGCLIKRKRAKYVWILHNDQTRNWIKYPTPGCISKATIHENVDGITKRHQGDGAYSLNKEQSKIACTRLACSELKDLSKRREK